MAESYVTEKDNAKAYSGDYYVARSSAWRENFKSGLGGYTKSQTPHYREFFDDFTGGLEGYAWGPTYATNKTFQDTVEISGTLFPARSLTDVFDVGGKYVGHSLLEQENTHSGILFNVADFKNYHGLLIDSEKTQHHVSLVEVTDGALNVLKQLKGGLTLGAWYTLKVFWKSVERAKLTLIDHKGAEIASFEHNITPAKTGGEVAKGFGWSIGNDGRLDMIETEY